MDTRMVFRIFLLTALFAAVFFAVTADAAQNSVFPKPSRCNAKIWNIGLPEGTTCAGSIKTLHLGSDPKALQIFGIKSRLKPDLSYANIFCQQYTGDSSSYATWASVHNYCNGCDQRISWWNGSTWVTQRACAGTLNVQRLICATSCNNVTTLNLQASASPNPSIVGQAVTFTATATGGTGSYIYNWSGDCTGNSATCVKTFSIVGSYSSTVTVVSGSQTETFTVPVQINPNCVANYSKHCSGGDVYWYDSCGTRGGLFQDCTSSQACETDRCVDITCSTNNDCGTDGFTGNYYCQGNSVYGNYKTWTCDNPGASNASCSSSISQREKQNCAATNKICSTATATCIDACTSHDHKGCYGGHVYWYNSCGTLEERFQTCTLTESCNAGACVTNLSANITVNPNPANVGETVTFTANASGGAGSYAYTWSGACAGSNQTCQAAFTSAGAYTAYVTVTSGNFSYPAANTVTVSQQCASHDHKGCYNGDSYWYDSCNNRQDKFQTCSNGCADGVCNNPALSVTASYSPNPATTGQAVTFTATATGGTGAYTYNWTGACTGTSRTCTQTFTSAGSYTANVTVVSGSQSFPASVTATVSHQCTTHSYKACTTRSRHVFWYNSCGTVEDMAEDCGFGTCQNGQCILNFFSLSCVANPSQVYTNQNVIFNSFINLPNNRLMAAMPSATSNPAYIYSWSGACTGSSNTCQRSFANPGTQTANLSVTIGTVTRTTSCSVSVSASAASYGPYSHNPSYSFIVK